MPVHVNCDLGVDGRGVREPYGIADAAAEVGTRGDAHERRDRLTRNHRTPQPEPRGRGTGLGPTALHEPHVVRVPEPDRALLEKEHLVAGVRLDTRRRRHRRVDGAGRVDVRHANPERGRLRNLGAGLVEQHRVQPLHLLSGTDRADLSLERRERHRPHQLDREAGDERRRPGIVLFARVREQRARRGTVQRAGIPRAPRQRRRHETTAVTFEERAVPRDRVVVSHEKERMASGRATVARMRDASRALDGKVALITGAASGQGRAAAELFAACGASVVVVDVNDDGAHETVALIEKDGGVARAVHADVARRTDCDDMITAAIDVYGALDVLYNNAAIQMSGRLVETTEAMWDITIATNLT